MYKHPPHNEYLFFASPQLAKQPGTPFLLEAVVVRRIHLGFEAANPRYTLPLLGPPSHPIPSNLTFPLLQPCFLHLIPPNGCTSPKLNCN
ncbi:hypothetical protein AMTRI_Chr01g137750 [Amborella trichopoda]